MNRIAAKQRSNGSPEPDRKRKSHYDRLSGWYDLLTDRSERKSRELGPKLFLVGEGEQALVIGSGTGHGVVSLAQAVGDTGRAFGIDISEGMLEVARQRVSDSGLAGRVELRCGDATALPFRAEFFDALFMSFRLERAGVAAARAQAVGDYLATKWQIARERIRVTNSKGSKRTIKLRIKTMV